ncbi:MAG TPA: substrate-binding domain-containing protein [Clostridia bacterium]|nr:substrate-binding domain-containing protein [Clostridia bacterium]
MVQGDFSVTCGYHAVRTWIEAGCLPDAVFASDDNTAFGILDAAREYGIDVPGSLSIIGYDDHPYASLLHPGISTIRQPSERIGSAAAELLMDLIEGRPARTKITLKPFLILRGTTK